MLTKQMDVERLDNFILENKTSKILEGVNISNFEESGIFALASNCSGRPNSNASVQRLINIISDKLVYNTNSVATKTQTQIVINGNNIYVRNRTASTSTDVWNSWSSWEKIPRTINDLSISFYSTNIDLASSSVVDYIVSEASYGYSSIDPTPNRLYIDVSLPAIATTTSKILLEVNSTGTYYGFLYNLFSKYAYLTNLTISDDAIQSIRLAPTSTTNGKLCYLFLSRTPASKSSDGYNHMAIGLKPIVAITNGSILNVCMAV